MLPCQTCWVNICQEVFFFLFSDLSHILGLIILMACIRISGLKTIYHFIIGAMSLLTFIMIVDIFDHFH